MTPVSVGPRLSWGVVVTTLVTAVLLAYRPMLVPLLIAVALMFDVARPEVADKCPMTVVRWPSALARFAPWVPVLTGIGWMLYAAPLPSDDLLRHINGKAWEFSYADHFGQHDVRMDWSFWVGFDDAVGTLHEAIGRDVLRTTRIVRAVLVLIVGAALVRASRACNHDPLVQVIVVSSCLLWLLWPRLNLGRPEALYTAVVLAGIVLSRLQWVALGFLLIPGYCLAPVYAVGSVLLGRDEEPQLGRLARNLTTGALVAMGGALFWWTYSAGDLWRVLGVLGQVAQVNQHQDQVVGELRPLMDSLKSVWFLVVVGALVALSWASPRRVGVGSRRRAAWLVAVACFFALPDHARYAPLVFTLLVLACSALLPPPKLTVVQRAVGTLAAVAAGISMLGIRGAVEADDEVLRGLMVRQPGAQILAPFNQSLYLATSANPDSIVTPIFDLASIKPAAREVVAELTRGSLNCDKVRGLQRFDYVVENTLQGRPPACLELVRIAGGWRLWRVTAEGQP